MWSILSFLFLILCELGASVPVIPKPILDIQDVTSYSITVNWTMPPNELFSEFIVEISPEEGDVVDYSPTDMRRTFTNLTPGVLYTITVRTVREESLSDPSVIRQDTVPLEPSNLQLRAFDTLVLTLEGPYFGDSEFTVETHGVEASWEAPSNGASECFHAIIEDRDGLQAIPGEKDEILRGEQLRQFINLTPGKKYKITVFSSTCGDGHLGELRSDGISAEIMVPPGAPPVIAVKDDVTSSELTWDEPEGSYDDFEVVVVSDSSVTVEEPSDPANLGRTLTGLNPCTMYEVEVYTLFNGQRSQSPSTAVVSTRSMKPSGVRIIDYTDNSLTVSWIAPANAKDTDYFVELSSPDGNTFSISNETTVTFTDLVPGTEYTISVQALCPRNRTLTSFPTVLTYSTKPNPPRLTSLECIHTGANNSIKSLYDQVPWEAPDPSRITVAWDKPTIGNWDNFIVDYSPYTFEEGLSSPLGPIVIPGDQVLTTIDIPVSGRVMTLSIRTVRNNTYSEPVVKQVTCGGAEDEAILRCRSYLLYWNIIITPIQGGVFLRIDIPNYPIHNATVYTGDGSIVFFNNSFVIPNPCDDFPGSRVVVYPACPEFLPFCPVISRPICVHRRGRFEEVDACCNNRLYHTNNQICCHSKLIRKDRRDSEECCASKWYDKTTHRCCGNGLTTPLNRGTC